MTSGARGLSMRRFFSSSPHPYDEVTWVKRDVQQTNWKTGDVIFEQKGVEFPDFWSDDAVQITTSKYFRGRVGTPEREWSLRQLISRVVDVYVSTGWTQGYFATDKDAAVFGDELTWLLLHQRFFFNSPVWFNVGVPGESQQVSACQPYDALVSTSEGLVPIGYLHESHADKRHVSVRVHGDGSMSPITATKANETKEVLRLSTDAGYHIDVTRDHRVWRYAEKNSGFVNAGDMAVGDRLLWSGRYYTWDADMDDTAVQDAALAGWLFSGGAIGCDEHGHFLEIPVRSGSESALRHLLVSRFPHATSFNTVQGENGCPYSNGRSGSFTVKLYDEKVLDYATCWLDPSTAMRTLFEAPTSHVAAYLYALMISRGVLHHDSASTSVSVSTTTREHAVMVQLLLSMLGVFSHVVPHVGGRDDASWMVEVRGGTIDMHRRLSEALCVDVTHDGLADATTATRRTRAGNTVEAMPVTVTSIESLGDQPVFDIQTKAGEYLTGGGILVHNCFLLEVEDSMESILNWYTEEGLIFKGGSGAGVNLSHLRGKDEHLTGGGVSSGPVSFMRTSDANAGSIKSGGKNRRAAKLVCLDVDHPDIEEFIRTKSDEEKKIKVLRDAGFDMGLGGKDLDSVSFQNVNISVQVTDEFMKAVERDEDFDLVGRHDTNDDGTPVVTKTVKARDVMRQIAHSAWQCADPGLQYADTINRWNCVPNSGRIETSNPCSEFVFINNTSCNLGSFNLLTFRNEDGSFNIEAFTRAVDIATIAMDISITFADFPTEKISANSREFRPIGLGFSNLGALLMTSALPYDSDRGRQCAAAITSLMMARAYATSARMASMVGPYAHFGENKEPHLDVVRRHVDANRDADARVDDGDVLIRPIQQAATAQWAKTVSACERHGIRNAQVSLLAPTGTISFAMGCDTTGIEPDFSLIKFKKTSDGGSMSIVNRSIPLALRTLGYSESDGRDIEAWIMGHGTVVGAPHLKEEHLSIFDCAVGDRAISPMGHLRMLESTQPFLSGAVSKCVTADTRVVTSEGIRKIGSWYRNEKPDTFSPLNVTVASRQGCENAAEFYYGGTREIVRVGLENGTSIKGTMNHRVLTMTSDGERLEWKKTTQLHVGDIVVMKLGSDLWVEEAPSITPPEVDYEWIDATVPTTMTEDMAWLMGVLTTDKAAFVHPIWMFSVSNDDCSMLERIVDVVKRLFHVDAVIHMWKNRCPSVTWSSKTLFDLLISDDCGVIRRNPNKAIPSIILRSPKDMVAAYLSGLTWGATLGKDGWYFASTSHELLEDLQTVLYNVGINNRCRPVKAHECERDSSEVCVTAGDATRLVEWIAIDEHHKKVLVNRVEHYWWDNMPATDAIPVAPRLCGVEADARVTDRDDIRDAMERGEHIPDGVREAIDNSYIFSPVTSIDVCDDEDVFDIAVPGSMSFIANGIINHNTVNLPQSATEDDI